MEIGTIGAGAFSQTFAKLAFGGTCGSTLSGPVTSSIINDAGIWSFDGKGNIKIHDSGMLILVNPPTDASDF